MIGHDDTTILKDSLPSATGTLTSPGQRLSAIMEQFQSLGLTGISADKRKSILKGLSEEQVKNLQATLVSAGFKDVGTIDGVVGKNTIKGVEQVFAKNALGEIFAEMDASDKETVRRIQDSLNTLGHNAGTEDGVFGAKTAAAVGRYLNEEKLGPGSLPENVRGQLKEHAIKLDSETPIELTGVKPSSFSIDPALAAVLGAYEQNEDDVKMIQTFLKKNGYDVGGIDGDFGPATTKQFVKFLEENPAYHSAIGPNLVLETEIYATDNKVSDDLRKSLNLRDLSKMPTPNDEVRYQAYKDYFRSEGKPEELARGIKLASEMTGVPMEKLFVVMKQESINFGDYNPRRGNSSANRIADNYGQFTNQTYNHMNNAYGDLARRELGREGVQIDGSDWRSNPMVAPYMVAKYLQETGSYPAYVLPVMKNKGDSDAIVARQFPAEARSNKHIFYDGKTPLSFAQAKEKINETLSDDIKTERDIVLSAQRETLKKEIMMRQGENRPYINDSIDPKNRLAGHDTIAGLVGDSTNPEAATAKLNLAGSFAKAADLMKIADLDPNGKGPKLGPGPSNDLTIG